MSSVPPALDKRPCCSHVFLFCRSIQGATNTRDNERVCFSSRSKSHHQSAVQSARVVIANGPNPPSRIFLTAHREGHSAVVYNRPELATLGFVCNLWMIVQLDSIVGWSRPPPHGARWRAQINGRPIRSLLHSHIPVPQCIARNI